MGEETYDLERGFSFFRSGAQHDLAEGFHEAFEVHFRGWRLYCKVTNL